MEQKKVKVRETEYTLQMVDAGFYFKMLDMSKDKNGNLVNQMFMEKLLEFVVVSPRVKISDFTGRIYELRKLVKLAEEFVMGEPIEDEDEKNE